MAQGMADSTLKVTWLNKESLRKSLSLDVDYQPPVSHVKAGKGVP